MRGRKGEGMEEGREMKGGREDGKNKGENTGT